MTIVEKWFICVVTLKLCFNSSRNIHLLVDLCKKNVRFSIFKYNRLMNYSLQQY